MAAAATAIESTGSRRAVVRSERFMEWQRELSSSRAIHGGRKRQEETDVEAAGMKKTFLKSEEDGVKPQGEQESDEREAEGEEPVADLGVGDANGVGHGIKRKKQLHQRQRSDIKKLRKDNEVDQKRIPCAQSKEKSPPPSEGEGGRMRRCKQQNAQPTQGTPNSKRQLQPLAPAQQQAQARLGQPISRRRQQRVPASNSPLKEEKDRVLRSLTRNRGSETPPAAPPVPTGGKGAKRSKRVALRLANEEPPPPPLKLPKLHLGLTRKEIQEDWVKITGHKYTGKPKKSTIVQRGLGLCTSLTCPSSIRYLNEPQ